MPDRRTSDPQSMDRILLRTVQPNPNGVPVVLNCPQTTEEDDCPILREEVEAAVKSLKKGKSAGIDNIPAELVQAGGEALITTLTTICNKIWQTGEWPPPGLSH